MKLVGTNHLVKINGNCISVQGTVNLRGLDRPIDYLFPGKDGWTTLVLRWRSDVPYIVERLKNNGTL